MNVLFINLIAYLIWGFTTYLKERKISTYLFMILFYAFLAGMGYFTTQNGIYQNTFGNINVDRLPVLPYVLCFVTYLILIYPLRSLSKVDISASDWLFKSQFRIFVNLWIVLAILLTLQKFSEAAISIATGLGDAYESRHIDGDILFQYDNFFLAQLNGKGPFIMHATLPVIIFYSFVGMYRNLVSNTKGLILFVLSFLWSFLSSVASGSRGGIFITAFCVIFFIIIFADYIPKKQLHKMLYIFILGIIIFIFYSWIITIDRVGESGGLDSIFRYFGESFPNLGNIFWDNVLYHPMGERLFPINENDFYSTQDFYDYWGMKTGVPVLCFKTYFGDLYIEFGIIGAFVFTIASSILAQYFLFKKGTSVISLPFIYFYFQICVFSFSGFTKGGHHALFQIYIIVLFTIYLFYLKKTSHI